MNIGHFGFLIHRADPQSRPVVIIIFIHGVCTSVHKQNKFQVRIVIATGRFVGLPERIIDDTHVFLWTYITDLNIGISQAFLNLY